MQMILNPFGYILIYRVVVPLIFIYNLFSNQNTTFALENIFIFILSLFFQLIMIIALIYQLNKIAKNSKPVSRYYTVSQFNLLLIISILAVLIIYKWQDIPLFNLAGSDAVVDIMSKNKLENVLVFGCINMLGIILFFICILDKRRFIRLICLVLSLFTVLIYMKKSGFLNWVLFYSFFQFLFFGSTRIFGVIFSICVGGVYGMYVYAKTIGIELVSFWTLLREFYLMFYISASSYLRYLITYDGISLVKDYQATLPDIYGIFVYFLNPIFAFLFNAGIDSAIGPYVVGWHHGYRNNLFGFNPTIMVELWFVLGPIFAIILILPILFLIFICLTQLMLKARSLVVQQSKIIHYYLIYMLINFGLNVQFSALNSIRSLLIGILLYTVGTAISRLRLFNKIVG